MYDETVKRLKNCATQAAPCLTCDMTDDGSCIETLMKKAADAIEQLSNAGSAYGRGWTLGYDAGREASKPQWISVTERLPEKYDCYYLVVLNNWNTDFCLYTKEKGFGMYITPKWWDANDEVTHWMRLPEPPKEE